MGPFAYAAGMLFLFCFFSCAAFFGGIVGTFHALEFAEIVEVKDGKNKLYISLYFGPFSYKIDVEERRTDVKK